MKVQTFDEYLAEARGQWTVPDLSGYHVSNSSVSKAQTRRAMKRCEAELARTQEVVTAALEEYDALVAAGELRPPTPEERLAQAAAGHPDLASTQAARRVQAKRLAKRKRKKR